MNLQTATTGSEYAFWEVFRYGNDKDIFEIIETGVSHFKGLRVQMKMTGSGLVMKAMGTHDTDNSEDIITPYGAITGATFKRVEQFIPVHIGDAVNALKEEKHNVFIKDKHDRFEKVTLYTYLEDIEVVDFDDLMGRQFYIKK